MIGNSFRHMYLGASQQLGGTQPNSSPISAQASKLLTAIRQVSPHAAHAFINDVADLTRHPISPSQAPASAQFTNLTTTLNNLTPDEMAQINHNFGHSIFGANGRVNETALYHTIYGNGNGGGSGHGPLISNQIGNHSGSNAQVTLTPSTSSSPLVAPTSQSNSGSPSTISAPNLTSATLIGSFEVQA